LNRVIALLLSITLLWGYGLYLERQNLLIQRENDYRRSFQELACHLAGLEDGLARIQAARSKEQRMLLLLGISHDAAKAQGKLSQLPLTALSLERTKELLRQVGEYATELAFDLAAGKEEDASSTLRSLWQRTRFINGEMAKMQAHLGGGPNRLVKFEQALLTGALGPIAADEGVDPLAKDLIMLEDGLGRLPDERVPRPSPRPAYVQLSGPELTEEELIQAARAFLGPERVGDAPLTVVGPSQGEVPTYKLEMRGPRERIVLELTRQGGQVVWMISDRMISERNLSVEEGMARGTAFLSSRGLRQLVPIFRAERGNQIAVIYAAKEEDVYVYPRQVRLTIGLDNGEVTAYEASGLFLEGKADRQARLTPTEAARQLHPALQVTDCRLVVTVGSRRDEVLAYEFLGRIEDEEYTVYINAQNGREERIVRGDLERGFKRLPREGPPPGGQ
jgi:spore germination protein